MIIKGWASVFGESDSHDDVTVKGCFVSDLKKFTFTRPMLLCHESTKIIGRWDLIEEREFGLWCEGTILDEEIQFLVKEQCLSGLSIGYVSRQHKRESGLRKLQVIELEEISLTPVPMNRAARIVEIIDA